jgi:ATP-binding cassette subfamily B protein
MSAPAPAKHRAPTRGDGLAEVVAGLRPFSRPHRGQLVSALLASVFLTLVQLAFPWPLKWLVDLGRAGEQRIATPAFLPAVADPAPWLAAAFALLGAALGFTEYWQRLAVTRYVVPTVNDARLALFTRFLESSARGDGVRDPGDIVTRVITDTSRLRGGLKGVLVHVLQHGLFVLGVFAVLLVVDVRLGFCYLFGLVIALAVALVGTRATADVARRRRGAESRRVGELLRALRSGDDVVVKDPARVRADALITQIKGRTAWAVQGVLAVTACAVLVVAMGLSRSGRVDPGDVALVTSYLLMLHHPMTRIGRQITRLGPQLTSAERLTRLARPGTLGTGET